MDLATMDLAQLKAEHPELVEQIRAAAIEEVKAAAYAKGFEAAVKAETDRIVGIVSLATEQGKREIGLRLAAIPSLTVDLAATILAATPEATPNGNPGAEFEAFMRKVNPRVESDAGGESGDVGHETASLLARMKKLDQETPRNLRSGQVVAGYDNKVG